MELNTFHSRVKALRKAKARQSLDKSFYTQVWCAKELGIARQTYLDLESGKTEPRLSIIVDLANLLECETMYLIYGDEKRAIENLLLPEEVEFILSGQKYLARKFKN